MPILPPRSSGRLIIGIVSKSTFIAGFLFTGAFALADTPPTVLIVPISLDAKDTAGANYSVANYLAQEMETEGRVAPVVWGLTDPVFRAAALDGKLGNVPDNPNGKQALEVAKRLKAGFVVLYSTKREKGSLVAKADLYSGSRKVWHKETNIAALTAGQSDAENVAASTARTWYMLMSREFFKEFPPKKKAVTPEPAPGQTPTVTLPIPTNPVKPQSNEALLKEFEALKKSGQTSQALGLMKDAVDLKPFDSERRRVLIQLLVDMGNPVAAAEEAKRAAGVIPEDKQLRSLAIRAYLAAGRAEDARNVLNEALLRDPNDQQTLLLAGRAYLAMLQPETALVSLDKVIKTGPNVDASFFRALTRSMLGGTDGCLLDLKEFQKLASNELPSVALERFQFAFTVLDSSLSKVSVELPKLLQSALMKPESKEVAEANEQLLMLSLSRGTFMEKLPVPELHTKSFERMQLAQKLMRQSMLDLGRFLKGNEDSKTDARINLGEAVKELNAAREAFLSEKGAPSNAGSNSLRP